MVSAMSFAVSFDSGAIFACSVRHARRSPQMAFVEQETSVLAGMGLSKPVRRRVHRVESLSHIRSLRLELDSHERKVSLQGAKAIKLRPQAPWPPAPAPAALPKSLSLPAMPQRAALPARVVRPPPWALFEEPNATEGPPASSEPLPPPRMPDGAALRIGADPPRMPTRERAWRDDMTAADEGRGPDPLTMFCLRRHARRFAPGGVASRTRMTNGFAASAIANARFCSVLDGCPWVREPAARPLEPLTNPPRQP